MTPPSRPRRKNQPAGPSHPTVRPAARYTICPEFPHRHVFRVRCEIDDPVPEGETLALPAWIPGSYLIRDFARHIVAFRATADGLPVAARKLAKDRWHVPVPAACHRLAVEIEVYAWDLSVRGAHLDDSHAFFNGSSVFLRVEGRESLPCELEVLPPPKPAGAEWAIATAMPAVHVDDAGFGSYRAADYAELIDHPFEIGRFARIDFSAGGVRHEVAITGRHRCDLERLRRDLRTICRWQLDFWGKPAPTDRYVFLVTAVGDGYGGLEHRASTALLCRRDSLPARGAAGDARDDQAAREAYRGFLGLASHEYFHTWLVKRIRPAEFVTLDLQHENLTELLWLFEGFTSYYDDLALLRCGLIDAGEYLSCLEKSVNAVQSAPGRLQQSLAQASQDAWIKYYRPDENSANASVSYYAKGALFALLLDLTLRRATAGKASLDDLMRRLWKDCAAGVPGVTEGDILRHAESLSGKRLGEFFATFIHGTDELPLARMLANFGVRTRREGDDRASLGVRLEAAEPRIACAFDGGAAQAAGLAGGDLLVAVGGLRVGNGNLDRLLDGLAIGDRVDVYAFRRDELLRFEVELRAAPHGAWKLSLEAKPGAGAKRLRKGWLGV